MGRPILDIAKEAAERDATAPAPAALFNTNDRIARTLRNAANDTIRDILARSKWQGLSEFHSQWAFSTQPGVYAYALPPDYLRMIENSEIRGSWPLGLVGPTSPQTWAHWIAGLGAVTAPMGWRIRNNVLFIEPTPSHAELLVIEYVSRWPVVKPVTFDDLDVSTIPTTAKAPHVLRDGFIAPGTRGDQPVQDDLSYGTGAGYDDGRWEQNIEEELVRLQPLSTRAPLAELRAEAFTADTDRPAFADDHALSLGMTWRLRRALGLPYAEHAAEYERQVEAMMSSDAGGARDFRLGDGEDAWDVAPLGDGRWLLS